MLHRVMNRSVLRTMSSASKGPIETTIAQKLQTTFNPTFLEVRNDSHKHAGHHGLRGAANTTESHFYVKCQSEVFNGKNLPSRHRLVYSLLDDEFKNHGLHALQMKLKGTDEKIN